MIYVSFTMQAIAHADSIFGEDGEGWMVSPFHVETSRRMERWVQDGAKVVQWIELVAGIRRQVFVQLARLAWGVTFFVTRSGAELAVRQ